MPVPPSPLSADELAFVCGPRSIYAASCDAEHRLTLVRVLACRPCAEGDALELLFHSLQAAALLRSVADTARIAVVFSAPDTNKTLQLKGSDARIVATPADADRRVSAHVREFAAVIGPMGFSDEFVHALLRGSAEPLSAVHFTPQARFEQTPGPAAGARL